MNWDGEFAFVAECVVFRGWAADNRAHRHATVQITLGLDGPVTILDVSKGRAVTDSALLVRPGVMHALQPGGKVWLVLLQPESLLAQHMLQRSKQEGVVSLPPEFVEGIHVIAPLANSLDGMRKPHKAVQIHDERLLKALKFLESVRGARPVERAATAVGLSVSRLRGLAQAHLEIPLARWLTLRQLQRAVQAMAQGASIAEAAIDAGFADQAHLTRQMRKTLGITPAMVEALTRESPRRFIQDTRHRQ